MNFQQVETPMQSTNDNATALPNIGSKYVHGRDLADVAKLVRADIAAAVKAGVLPAGLKVSVRIRRYSMGQSLDVFVTAAPGLCFLSVARVRYELASNPTWRMPSILSDSGAKALGAIERMVAAYDRTGERRSFFAFVDFGSDLERALRAEIKAAIVAVQEAS